MARRDNDLEFPAGCCAARGARAQDSGKGSHGADVPAPSTTERRESTLLSLRNPVHASITVLSTCGLILDLTRTPFALVAWAASLYTLAFAAARRLSSMGSNPLHRGLLQAGSIAAASLAAIATLFAVSQIYQSVAPSHAVSTSRGPSESALDEHIRHATRAIHELSATLLAAAGAFGSQEQEARDPEVIRARCTTATDRKRALHQQLGRGSHAPNGPHGTIAERNRAPGPQDPGLAPEANGPASPEIAGEESLAEVAENPTGGVEAPPEAAAASTSPGPPTVGGVPATVAP